MPITDEMITLFNTTKCTRAEKQLLVYDGFMVQISWCTRRSQNERLHCTLQKDLETTIIPFFCFCVGISHFCTVQSPSWCLDLLHLYIFSLPIKEIIEKRLENSSSDMPRVLNHFTVSETSENNEKYKSKGLSSWQHENPISFFSSKDFPFLLIKVEEQSPTQSKEVLSIKLEVSTEPNRSWYIWIRFWWRESCVWGTPGAQVLLLSS